MLGRFICPAARLEELHSTLDERASSLRVAPDAPHRASPIRLSALGRGGEDAAACLRGIREDFDAIADCHGRPGSMMRVEVFEVRVPEVTPELLDGVRSALQGAGRPNVRIHLEIPRGADWRAAVARSVQAIAAHNAARAPSGDPELPAREVVQPAPGELKQSPPNPIGFKLRCGGVTAAAFPSTDEVAEALDACRVAGVPFKATAGLHHPVRSFREEVGAKMHGFVNVFGAALLAHEHGLGVKAIAEILAEEDPRVFRFSADAFAWRELSISTSRIRALRRDAVTSFGSCSFDEPREDLRSLELLDNGRARDTGSAAG
jgi:hypothetical protein